MSYFIAESLIKQRLINKLTTIDTKNILVTTDMKDVSFKNQIVPAVHIIYASDTVETNDSKNRGQGQAINQIWDIVIAVRNERTLLSNSGLSDADPIITDVLKSLQGHQLSPELGNLRRERSPYRTTHKDGYSYFSFAFSTKIIIIGYNDDE